MKGHGQLNKTVTAIATVAVTVLLLRQEWGTRGGELGWGGGGAK